ncbi:TPA_exp: Uncharacterized protein A8136_1118 [Trichophyton benhamiae CBS 112371]|nr:TPA_exp: Uncharacterized protein A8136_1118 [Trichophyton benhamiae CBS 112371]
MDPDFVHRQFPTSYLRTKLGSEVQFSVETRIEDTALHTAVEDHITNQLTERQQQQQQQQLLTWQPVDGRRELQHWLRVPPSLTPGPLSTPSASSAERQGSPKPADDSQTLCSSAPPSTLTPSEINRRGQQIIMQILQTPVSQEEADYLRSLPLFTPPRSSSGDQDFTLFPPAPAEGEEEEEELPAKEAISTNSPLDDTRQPPSTSPVSRSVSPNTLTLKPLQFDTATNSWPLPPIESVTRSFWDPIRDALREQVQVEKMEDTESWLRGLPSVDEMLEPEC